jgi:hypothetical protein
MSHSILASNAEAMHRAFAGNFLAVTVSINRWSDQKSDRTLADQLMRQHGVTATDAGRFVKNIMAGARGELDTVNRALNALRTYVYSISQPLAAKSAEDGQRRGPRVFPIAEAPDVLAGIKEREQAIDDALNTFYSMYNQRVGEALAAQGTMTGADEYPELDAIKRRFGYKTNITPLPEVADLAGRLNGMAIPASVVENFTESVLGEQRAQIEEAMTGMYDELVETTTYIAKQMAAKAGEEGGTRFHDSRVEQIRRLARQLKAAEGVVHSDFSALSEAVEALASVDYKQAKASIGLAADVAEQAAALANKLAALQPAQDGENPAEVQQAPAPEARTAAPEPANDDPFAALDAMFF